MSVLSWRRMKLLAFTPPITIPHATTRAANQSGRMRVGVSRAYSTGSACSRPNLKISFHCSSVRAFKSGLASTVWALASSFFSHCSIKSSALAGVTDKTTSANSAASLECSAGRRLLGRPECAMRCASSTDLLCPCGLHDDCLDALTSAADSPTSCAITGVAMIVMR